MDIYAEFFRDEKPANAIMEVSRLAEPGLEVEIEATAVLD